MSDATPSRPWGDRNLLFGILAVQMDFVGRDQLIAYARRGRETLAIWRHAFPRVRDLTNGFFLERAPRLCRRGLFLE